MIPNIIIIIIAGYFMRYREDIQSAVECLKDKARGWSEKEKEKTWNNQKNIGYTNGYVFFWIDLQISRKALK